MAALDVSAAEVTSEVDWTRCVVARGIAGRVELRFRGELAETWRVGSGLEADWNVLGADIADVALELHWDGRRLWVADRCGAGGVTVDGEVVRRHWRALAGRARIAFGSGALVVEAPGAAVVVDGEPPVVQDSGPIARALQEHPATPATQASPKKSDVREVMRAPTEAAPTPVRPPHRPSRPGSRPQSGWAPAVDLARQTLQGLGGEWGSDEQTPPRHPPRPSLAGETMQGIGVRRTPQRPDVVQAAVVTIHGADGTDRVDSKSSDPRQDETPFELAELEPARRDTPVVAPLAAPAGDSRPRLRLTDRPTLEDLPGARRISPLWWAAVAVLGYAVFMWLLDL